MFAHVGRPASYDCVDGIDAVEVDGDSGERAAGSQRYERDVRGRCGDDEHGGEDGADQRVHGHFLMIRATFSMPRLPTKNTMIIPAHVARSPLMGSVAQSAPTKLAITLSTRMDFPK